MNKKFPFPKRYWIYLIIFFICAILLICNIYRTDSWTGDKSFSNFVGRDWMLLVIFLFEEIIIVGVMFLFVFLACRISKKRDMEITKQWETEKHLEIKPGDYTYVWFDFANTKRALILKQDDKYILYVQEYDVHTGNWGYCNGVSIYDNLEEIKKTLFYEYDFYCEENTELDKHGDEMYVEEQKFSISSVQGITREEISFDIQHGVLEICFMDAYRSWCRKYCVTKPELKYVCDRTNVDGEKKMIFYSNPRVIVVANKEQEQQWVELIEKMKSFGYFSFDID